VDDGSSFAEQYRATTTCWLRAYIMVFGAVQKHHVGTAGQVNECGAYAFFAAQIQTI
tara:strand:+ start:32043 stop:32213 length:171 start_codon:yes stop_codon:yes gene_type:complete